MASIGRLKKPRSSPAAPAYVSWHLRLYIAGPSGKSKTALANLKWLRAERLPRNCEVEIIDLSQNPALARTDDIVALPTLARTVPLPPRRVLGDLSNTQRVLAGLGLAPH